MSRWQVLRAGTALSASEVLSQVLRFVRNVIVARILLPDDFGIAAACGMGIALLGMITNLGLERMMVQAEDGDTPEFNATAHTVLLLRGLGIGVVLLVCARPLAWLFDVPHAALAFVCVALVPMIQGLHHRDFVRLQRQLRFGATVACRLIPVIVTTLVAWPVALWLRNYWAFVLLMLGQEVLRLLVSHLLSERRYRLAWNVKIWTRFVGFGWPLLLNGLLMFAVFQGDRLIVGTLYSMSDLGIYSVAFGLAMAPALTAGSVCGQLLLPVLSKLRDDRASFTQQYRLSVRILAVVAALLGSAFALIGPALIVLLYGNKYAAAGTLIGMLGAMQAVRLLRVGSTTAAMALGDTRNGLHANIFRASALGLAVIFVVSGRPLYWIPAAGLAGETLALVVSVTCVYRRQGLATSICWKPGVILACALALSTLAAQTPIARSSALAATLAFVLIQLLLLLFVLVLFRDVRRACIFSCSAALRGIQIGSLSWRGAAARQD